MIAKYIEYGFYGVVAFFLLIFVLSGLIRGTKKTIVKLVALIVVAILSVIVTNILVAAFGGQAALLLNSLNNEQLSELFAASPELKVYATNIAAALVGPIVFIIVFVVLSLLFLIVEAIVNTATSGLTLLKGGLNRLVGIGVGVVCALLVSSCMLLPFAGYISLGNEVYGTLKTQGIITESNETTDTIEDILSSEDNSLISTEIKVTKGMFNSLTSIKNSAGKKSSAVDEIKVLCSIIPDIIDFTKTDFSKLEDIDLTPIDNIISKLGNSESIKQILAEILSTAGEKWANGESFMGANLKEMLPAEYANALDGILLRLKNTNSDKVIGDLRAFSDTVKTVAKTYKYLSTLNKPEGATKEELIEGAKEILGTITPESADIVADAISASMLEAVGLDGSSAEAISDLLAESLREIAAVDGAEAVEREAEAINAIIAYSTGAATASAEELINTVLSSTAISNAINTFAEQTDASSIAIPAEQKLMFDSEIAKYTLEHSDLSEEDKATLDALQGLFTVAAAG